MRVQATQLDDPLHLIRDASPCTLDLRRFECLPGCGRCCGYKVSLLKQDIAWLEAAGASADWFVDRDREPASGFEACLAGRSGFCVFLDSQRRCRQYQHRPLYCRLYPYIRETYMYTQLDVSLSCPGVGRGKALSDEELSEVLELDGSAAEHERLADSRRGAARTAEALLAFHGRLEPFEEIADRIRSAAEGGLEDMQVFLKSGASVIVGQMLPKSDGAPADPASLDAAAKELLRDYLLLWSLRQTLWRWTDAFVAVTPEVKSRSQAMLSFLLEIAEAVASRAAAAEGERAGREHVLDAIRECDSFYRTYCQGFRLEG